MATALQLNFGLERKSPRGCPAHAATCSVRWHFPLLGPLLLDNPVRGSWGSVTGSRRLAPTSGARQRASAAVVAAAPLSGCWDALSLPQLISFANVCVARYAKCHSRGTWTPKGSLCWKRVEVECDSYPRGRKGKGRKGRSRQKIKGREWLPLGGRLPGTGSAWFVLFCGCPSPFFDSSMF